MAQVWQIAGGTIHRNYSDVFLNYDLMIIGPAWGDYNENIDNYDKNKEFSVRRFTKEVNPGDIVLLRVGNKIVDIGIIPDSTETKEVGYLYNKDLFDDILGWDLQHTRRVIWQDFKNQLDKIQANIAPVFTSRQDRFSRVNKQLPSGIKSLFNNIKIRRLKNMPTDLRSPLDIELFGEKLFEKGLSNENVDKLINAIKRLKRLNKWYWNLGSGPVRPSENELVAYMVLPILLSLGWSEQLLAIEWKKVDLAVFSSTPSNEENCVMICEAKRLGKSLEEVVSQAKDYVKKIPLINCNKIITTDGIRIYLYQKNKGIWDTNPSGYINFNALRESHILPANTNAIDTLLLLSPAGINN